MTPLWDTWAGIVIPMSRTEKHICTCLYWALDLIKWQYYVPPQLISLSQTSAIWQVPTAGNLRLLVQQWPFPGVRWAINNFYIQNDLISSLCTKYCHWQDWGRRIPGQLDTLVDNNLHPVYQDYNCDAHYFCRTVDALTEMTYTEWSCLQYDPPILIPKVSCVFQSLELTAWHTNLNCHWLQFTLINKTVDEMVEEEVGGMS